METHSKVDPWIVEGWSCLQVLFPWFSLIPGSQHLQEYFPGTSCSSLAAREAAGFDSQLLDFSWNPQDFWHIPQCSAPFPSPVKLQRMKRLKNAEFWMLPFPFVSSGAGEWGKKWEKSLEKRGKNSALQSEDVMGIVQK